MADKIIVKNRKAWHDFEILERFEAGIALAGTEVKSIRQGKVKIVDAYCRISDNYQLELLQMEISPYAFGNIHNHKPDRPRRLLMHKREIIRLLSRVKEKGLTLIPINLYYKDGRVKVEIALCRGKKLYDKRASLKEKDDRLDMDRALRKTGG